MAHPRSWSRVLMLVACCVLPGFAAGPDDPPPGGAAPAPHSDHWSFQPIVRPRVPRVERSGWLRNPIDAFVLAKLESLGIAPSPEADRPTLIRRLSLDLTGLLPTPAEVDAFLRDTHPDAYERLVDRLLASAHFGERWARHWLDLARYADSDGYEKDSPRPYAWLYRDWVIDAVNRDLPFDEFTIEQLAGDLLPEATLEHHIATGFHRNTLTNREGGVDQEEYRNKANADRVNTTASVWLGLTMGCCTCHDHKYDPLTQREYYSMFAFFNTAQESDLPAPRPEELAAYQQAKKAFDDEHARLQAGRIAYENEELPARLAAWQDTGRAPAARWDVRDPVSVQATGGATLVEQPDGSLIAAGRSPATSTYTLEFVTELPGITALRLEVLPDARHPAKGPGRVKHGNFVLSEFTVEAAPATPRPALAAAAAGSAAPPTPVADVPPAHSAALPNTAARARVALANASADFSQQGYPAEAAIDGNPGTGWAVAPQVGVRHVAVFETASDLGDPNGIRLLVRIDQQHGGEHTIARLRIAATTAPRPIRADDMPDEIAQTLATPARARTAEQTTALAAYYRSIDPEWNKRAASVAEHAKKAPASPATKAMTLAENPRPPKTHVHVRGDFLRPGAEVAPGTPAVLPPFQPRSDRPDRLDLARWLVGPKHSLTARVTVNRFWQHLFGRGLVASVEDFGTRGDPPSHPELLDWLASQLMADGWSRKAMIRRIVTSSTYRQASHTRPELAERDPNNLLLARQNRYRLEAEIIRDLNLAASGLLNPAIGGPSVRPPQPAGISELTYAGSAKWVESTGADRYRRGMYTWFQRTSPYPMLTTFDAPDSNVSCVRRERSNTPLQALTLLNDAVFFEAAQVLGRRIVAESVATPEERLRYLCRVTLARDPSDSEASRLRALYERVTELARAQPDAAAKLAGNPAPNGVDRAELAAWVTVARAVLNLDEFVTRE